MYIMKKIIPWLICLCFCFVISYAHTAGDDVRQEHKAIINFEVNLIGLEPKTPDSALIIKVENKLALKENPQNLYISFAGRTEAEPTIEFEQPYPLNQYLEKLLKLTSY